MKHSNTHIWFWESDGRVIGMSTNERDAEHLSKHNLLKVKGKVVKLKKPMSTTRGDRLIGMLIR